TRWIQFGAFSPILRTHTTQNPDSERRIWAYPEPYSSIMRKTFQLRMALQPYIYTEARRTYDTGVAFLHPLYYDWPDADAAYTSKGEYVFGSQMIVDPVTRPVDDATQLAQQSVWIPSGEWIERATGKHFTGPFQTTRSFSISQIPVYLRAGAIAPMQPPMLHTGQKPVDPLILNIYPLNNHQTSAYKLYADASDSRAYERNICTWTPITGTQNGDQLTIHIAPVEGSYPGSITERAYQLRLPADWPPESVTVNGQHLAFAGQDPTKIGWRYEGNTLTTVITTPRYSVHTPVQVEVRRASGSAASLAQLDGFAGSIERLREAYDTLNALSPYAWSPDPLIKALQTGDRISYHPENSQKEIASFPQTYLEALTDVQNLVNAANVPDDELNKRLEHDHGFGGTTNPAARYKLGLNRALAMLKDCQPSTNNATQ
ncbi:MAG: DUF5110 domain-containing protein, partial [Acidobacteriaceae bacterium]